MKCISLILILSCFSDLVAQDGRLNQAADSLRMVVDSSRSDKTELFNVNYDLFGRLMNSDVQEAAKYLEICERNAMELGDSLFIAMVLHGKGYVMLEQGNPMLAIEYLKLALDVAKRNVFEERTIFILNSLAIAYSSNMQYDKALLIHLESLRARERGAKFGSDISLALANIGSVYAELGDYEKASDYYSQSYEVKVKSGIYSDLPYLLANIAAAEINQHQYSEALNSINKAKSICDSVECNQRILGELGLLEGTCKLALGEVKSGLSILKKISPVLRKLSSQSSLSECYFRIAVGLARNKRYELALQYCDSSCFTNTNSVSRRLQVKRLILKGKCMAALKRYDSAFLFVLRGYSLDSSLTQSILANRISAVEASMLERENVLKIEAQEEVLRYQRDKLVDNEVLMFAILMIVVLISFLFVASVRISRQRRRINSLLSDRIVESTYELSNAHNSLGHSHDNLKLLITRMESILLSEFATLKGLNMLSRIESSDEERQYIMKAEEICLRLVKVLKDFKEVYIKL